MHREMDALDQDCHVDALRDSMTNRTFGLAKTAQLVHTLQIEVSPANQFQPVTVLDNTQDLLPTAMLAKYAQQDGK